MRQNVMFACECCEFKTENKEFMEYHETEHLIEKGLLCRCQHPNEGQRSLSIRCQTLGYGMGARVSLKLGSNPQIYTWVDTRCDSGTEKSLDINFCPLCGRSLRK